MQIDCLDREHRMRKAGYPGLVARGTMSQAQADLAIALIGDAIATLRTVQARGMRSFKGKHVDQASLVIHFETPAARADFVALVREAAPGATMEIPS